jgi:uncharacterized protein (DUF58 family)
VTESPPPLVPADVRHRLKALQLRPRRAAGAHGIGQHASRSRGSGLEFAQYRAYEPGDELRQVDWKLYARSDRFFVRESERESPITLWLLLDSSASMQQADRARLDYSRLDAARALAACVAELAIAQGDRFGMAAVSADGLQLLPAHAGLRQRDQLHLQLRSLRPHGQWPALDTLRPLWERVAAQDLVFAIGDGFDDGFIELLTRLSAARREVVFAQLLSAEERDFPFAAGHRFIDPETGVELLGDGRALRAGYLQRFEHAQAQLRARLHATGVLHHTGYLDQPIDSVLQALYSQRSGR